MAMFVNAEQKKEDSFRRCKIHVVPVFVSSELAVGERIYEIYIYPVNDYIIFPPKARCKINPPRSVEQQRVKLLFTSTPLRASTFTYEISIIIVDRVKQIIFNDKSFCRWSRGENNRSVAIRETVRKDRGRA